MQCGQQTPGIPWRPKQVGGFDQSSEFVRRNKGDIACAPAPNDNCFLIVDNPV
jgi:hypothetical protein